MDAWLRSWKKERKIVIVLSPALLGNTFSVLNLIQREELMGLACEWSFDQGKGILVRVSGEFELSEVKLTD